MPKKAKPQELKPESPARPIAGEPAQGLSSWRTHCLSDEMAGSLVTTKSALAAGAHVRRTETMRNLSALQNTTSRRIHLNPHEQKALAFVDALIVFHATTSALFDAIDKFMFDEQASLTPLFKAAKRWDTARQKLIEKIRFIAYLIDSPDRPLDLRMSMILTMQLRELGSYGYGSLFGCGIYDAQVMRATLARCSLQMRMWLLNKIGALDRQTSKVAAMLALPRPSAAGDGPAADDPALHRDDVTILRVLAVENRAMHQVDIETATTKLRPPLSRATIGKRLKALRDLGLVHRPHGDRGGDAITAPGREALRRVPLGGD